MGTAVVPYHLNFTAKQFPSGLWLQWSDKLHGHAIDVLTFERSFKHATGQARLALDMVTSRMPNARDYLEAHRGDYLWSEQVLAHGQEYRADEAEPWPVREPWQCFGNAYSLAKESRGRIQYVEGMCVSPMGGLLHAWGVCDGLVLDYTWPAPHLNRYFGVAFSLEFLDRIGLHGGVFSRWDPVGKYLNNRKAKV